MKLVSVLLLAAFAAVGQQRGGVPDSDLGYRIGQIDAKIEALRGDVKRVDDRVAALESKVSGVESRIGVLDVKFASMETKLGIIIAGLALVLGTIIPLLIKQFWPARTFGDLLPPDRLKSLLSNVPPEAASSISRIEVEAMVANMANQQHDDMRALQREVEELRERVRNKPTG